MPKPIPGVNQCRSRIHQIQLDYLDRQRKKKMLGLGLCAAATLASAIWLLAALI